MEPKTISIVEAGQRWNAAYESDGKAVCVMSAYGSERASIGRKPAALVAENLFRQIVQRRARAR
ncbi:hypothetical protein [Caulobacter sp. BP25]|uniref:hypothetical protein n=1 Tax=Caulobacter sp. BP25 TaxID=2048900 RepID=UPI000C12C38A|nr:hypothetical protein [Caulobacter sp. BP25]PHY20944.1 hypothetical protein CSW59_06970 [Caulobacter sp. BP25]